MKRKVFFLQEIGGGLLLVWCLKRIQEYDLTEMGKVVIPAHLDDFVNVMCVFCTTMRSYENGLVSILLCLVYAIQSLEVRRCSEISYFLWTHCQKVKKCDFFSAPV